MNDECKPKRQKYTWEIFRDLKDAIKTLQDRNCSQFEIEEYI